jgi:hypothetical protein
MRQFQPQHIAVKRNRARQVGHGQVGFIDAGNLVGQALGHRATMPARAPQSKGLPLGAGRRIIGLSMYEVASARAYYRRD